MMWKIADLELIAFTNKYWVHGWSYEKLGKYFGLSANTTRRKIIRVRIAEKKEEEPWASVIKTMESAST